MFRVLIVVLVALACSLSAEVPRLAIIPLEEAPILHNLEATLTAQFAESQDVALVERSEIKKLADEQKITTEAVRTLLNADGLILLTAPNFGDTDEIWARFVDVQTGTILAFRHDDQASIAPARWATGVATSVRAALPNLAARNEKLTTFSLLNFRAETGVKDSSELERGLLTGISRRLMAEPGVQVMERWRMGELAWEKGIRTEPSPEFLAGRVLVEGSFHSAADGAITLTLTTRQDEESHETVLTGEVAQLPDLAESAAQALLRRYQGKEPSGVWDRAAEAKEFFSEARWAQRIGAYQEAAYAAESAWALGLRDDPLLLLRIGAHAHLGCTGKFSSRWILCAFLPTAYDMEAATIALRLSGDYLARAEERPLSEEETGVISKALQGSLGILLAHCEKVPPPDTERALAEMRRLAKDLFMHFRQGSQEHGDLQRIYHLNALYLSVLYTDAGETLEGYDQLLADRQQLKDPLERAWLLGRLAEGHDHHTVDRDGRIPDNLVSTNIRQVPWIASKRPEDRAENMRIWIDYLEKRSQTDSFVARVDFSLLLILAYQSYEDRMRAMDSLFSYLEENAEAVIRSENALYLVNVIQHGLYTSSANSGDYKSMRTFRPRLGKLCQQILVSYYSLEEPVEVAEVISLASYALFELEENAEMGRQLYQLAKRFRPDASRHSKEPRYHDGLIRKLEAIGLGKAETTGERGLILEELEHGNGIDCLAVRGERLWVLSGSELLQYRLPALELVRTIILPKAERLSTFYYHDKLAIGDDHVLVFRSGLVDLYEKGAETVTRLPLPGEDYAAVAYHGGKFVLGFQDPFRRFAPEKNAGIFRIDPETHEFETLASSRRRPAQNALDDCPSYGIYNFFTDASGTLYAATRQPEPPEYAVYSWGEDERTWTKVFERDQPLLISGSGENLLCFDAYRKIPDVHLLDPKDWQTTPLLGGAEPPARWKLNSEEAMNMSGMEYDSCAVYQDGMLFYAEGRSGNQSTTALMQYGGKAGIEGRRIPLGAEAETRFPNNLSATPTGLLLWRKGSSELWHVTFEKLKTFVLSKEP